MKEEYLEKMENLLGARSLHFDDSNDVDPPTACDSADVDPKGIYKKYYKQPLADPKNVVLSIRDTPCRNPVKNR